ncbi:radial spoke head protein 9 [Cochliomyia hominivorax]
MNIQYFNEGLENLMYCGIKLSPEKKILIENSLIVLQNKNRFESILFWGRINGIIKDYYIAFGYTKDCLRDRKYFFSVDGYQWLFLSFVQNPKIFQAAMLCHEPFSGDPSIIRRIKLDPIFNIDANQVISASLPEEIQLIEEERLAAIVFIISEECAICPRGALYKLTDGCVVLNKFFRGLNYLQCEDISYYQIYRLPRNDLEMNLSIRTDYNYPIDFMDSLECVIPKGTAFSLNLHYNKRLIIIKSCIWPGMTFFHKINSYKNGFLYFGNGKKNYDLMFMF